MRTPLPISSRPMTAQQRGVLVRRILRVWRSSTADRVAEGMIWYAEAHDIARALTPHDVRVGAGVLAALSPQQRWDVNVRDARTAVRTGTARGTHTGCQTRKADAILAGAHPLDVLAGPKERAFYACIVDPESAATVVVDRHAHDVAAGRPYGEAPRGLSVPGRYRNVADAYVRAAEIASAEIGRTVTPSWLQATTWLTWRDLHSSAWVAESDASVEHVAAEILAVGA